MNLDNAGIRLADLKQKSDFPFAPLEGVGPNLAGWGVIETCLLLPQSIAVMVGPSACLRHSAFMAHARGFTDRFYMLCMSELDMTLGNHLENIERGVADIISRRDEKVVFLIVGCPDYILGTDFTGVISRLEKSTGRRIILGAMAPITIGMKESPFTSAYTSFFEFLKDKDRDSSESVVNILGTFMPLPESSELYQVLNGAGIDKVLQIPLCRDLDEFSGMAKGTASVVMHPLANGLCGKMEKEMGIQSCFAPMSYGFSSIREQYDKIGGAIGCSFELDELEKSAGEKTVEMFKMIRGKKTAVGCSINGSPFELALCLLENGVDVETLFARGTIKPYEWGLMDNLRKIKPEIMVYNASHPALCGKTDPFDSIELAYGVDAGMYCKEAVNVPLSRYQEQAYGYEATIWMLEQTMEAMNNPVRNYDWIYEHDFLI
jgi:nitrogenase molybdenum-cofactor synthesis protein NifE